jgi:hypothetical protein
LLLFFICHVEYAIAISPPTLLAFLTGLRSYSIQHFL